MRMRILSLPCIALGLVLLAAAPQPGSNAFATWQSSAPPDARRVLLLAFDPAQTTVHWTLPATLHTVHGTFQLKSGSLRIEPGGGATGEILVDATTGKSGNDGRDQKMHKEILESAKFSDIVFRADHLEGAISQTGASTVKLHGSFSLHGSSHEITVPVQASLAGDHWTATCSFNVPYVEWGLKNPSTFLLKVKPEVQVDLEAAGKFQLADH